jgi:hypothetical protein
LAWLRQPGDFESLDVYNHINHLRGVGMKTLLRVIGILIILGGVTFFLQGINILPGSFMTGDRQWAINGGIMTIIGIILIFSAKYLIK